MAFVVLYDANVLYPSTLRDLLIRISQAGLVQAKWTDQILDEVFRNLVANRSSTPPTCSTPTTGTCSPPPSRPAQVIVTNNLKDFPAGTLDAWDMEAKSPDAFILDQIDLSREMVYGAIQRIADSREKPPATFADVLTMLERDGLVESAAALRP